MIGRNPLNFGNIGNNAVDASYGSADNTDGARGDYSFASGFNTAAASTGTVAMGYQSTASGQYSIAIGYQSKAYAFGSVALGYQNTSNSSTSFTAGSGNTTGGGGSVALGMSNVAYGLASVSLGNANKAEAEASIAIGDNTSTKNKAEIAAGSFNTLDTSSDISFSQNSRRLFTIGNGVSSTVLSDAFTVLRNAKVGIDIDNFETTASDSKLQVNGGIQIKSETTTLDAANCNSNTRGKIIFVNDNFYGCKSTGWVQLNN